MSKWIAEFDLEDGDTIPEHMDLEYKGARIDFHCRPKEPILDKITEEIQALRGCSCWDSDGIIDEVLQIIDKYKAESEE